MTHGSSSLKMTPLRCTLCKWLPTRKRDADAALRGRSRLSTRINRKERNTEQRDSTPDCSAQADCGAVAVSGKNRGYEQSEIVNVRLLPQSQGEGSKRSAILKRALCRFLEVRDKPVTRRPAWRRRGMNCTHRSSPNFILDYQSPSPISQRDGLHLNILSSQRNYDTPLLFLLYNGRKILYETPALRFQRSW